MSRPLRIDIEEGWYHVMSRGTERRTIFEDDTYGTHFLELLSEVSERFAVEIHAYVLMGTHYHLIMRTPHANCSQAMQWLNMSYSAWFNAKKQRVGHVFQGRFRSTLIDGNGSWLLAMSAYVHLNPVRTSSLGLGKCEKKAEALGWKEPDRERVAERLKALRLHVWSSYRAYGNYARSPDWLVTDEVLRRAGGKAAYRKFVQQHITRGFDIAKFGGLTERVAIGGQRFLEKVRGLAGKISPEQPKCSFVEKRVAFDRIVQVVEDVKGEPWQAFRGRYGDWGTALVLYLARKHSGLSLREIGEHVDAMDYKAVSARVMRFKKQLASDSSLRRKVEQCIKEL